MLLWVLWLTIITLGLFTLLILARRANGPRRNKGAVVKYGRWRGPSPRPRLQHGPRRLHSLQWTFRKHRRSLHRYIAVGIASCIGHNIIFMKSDHSDTFHFASDWKQINLFTIVLIVLGHRFGRPCDATPGLCWTLNFAYSYKIVFPNGSGLNLAVILRVLTHRNFLL